MGLEHYRFRKVGSTSVVECLNNVDEDNPDDKRTSLKITKKDWVIDMSKRKKN
jgi:hypothetical protein